MRINTNVAALGAHQNLTRTQSSVQDSMAKLSSGFRITRAGDDAAGLSIANNLRTTTRALATASRNIEQAQSLFQIAEGAAGSIQKIVERMKELATQAATDTNDSQRSTLNEEFQNLKTEITRIADSTEFQGSKLIDGSFNNKTLQIGAGNSANEQLSVALGNLRTLGLGSSNLTNRANAQAAMSSIDSQQSAAAAAVFTSADDLSTLANGETITLGAFSFTFAGAVGDSNASKLTAINTALTSAGSDYVASDAGGKLRLTAQTPGDTTNTWGGTFSSGTETTVGADAVPGALGQVNAVLSKIGAYQNRLDYAQGNVKTAIVNISAAESVIRDVDMAEEMTKFSKQQILAQAGTAMLAQANQASQGVLQLLRG